MTVFLVKGLALYLDSPEYSQPVDTGSDHNHESTSSFLLLRPGFKVSLQVFAAASETKTRFLHHSYSQNEQGSSDGYLQR